MEVSQLAEDATQGRIGGVLMTIFLAGFMWVAKTTFEHVGQLSGIRHDIQLNEHQSELLRQQYDEIVRMLNEKTQSRFTREDADKLVSYIKDLEAEQAETKDSLIREYASLKVEIANVGVKAIAVAANSQPGLPRDAGLRSPQLQRLENQIAALQTEVVRLQRQASRTVSNRGAVLEPPRTRVAQPPLERVPTKHR